MRKLEGKIAVVTGGNSGIGLATAQRFAENGAHVFILARRSSELENAVKMIGKNVTGVEGDVANLADLGRLYDAARQKGAIDILFANAALGEFAPVGQVSEAHLDRVLGLNVKGLLFTVQKALPLLRDGGSIILNALPASAQDAPALGMYGAVRAAMRSLARSWTVDLDSRQIRVNVISPLPSDAPRPREREKVRAKRARTTPDEVADIASVLASDESSFITGIEVLVASGSA
ncbi:MAG TPA: SDR family oxidoreductase [Polyangiaceae bacterium]|nr:SDR family oxidoreductase [Polyangiaceae bacterium]